MKLKTILKRILWSILGIVVIGILWVSLFIYRATIGMPYYESKPIAIEEPLRDFSVLVFSKTNGFNHAGAIKGAKELFSEMGREEGWSVVFTSSGGAFNEDQLAKFDLVIWNNVTGRTLKDEQRDAFRKYIENGGGYLGIHGSGDFSHHWDWYDNELLGTSFSHHPLNPQIQLGTLLKECDSSFDNCQLLPEKIEMPEEWYVFFTNPRDKGCDIIYTLQAGDINPSGNLSFLIKNKDWGMGDDHPIVWKRNVGQGRSFYSAIGHLRSSFENPGHIKLLKAAIEWTGDINLSNNITQ